MAKDCLKVLDQINGGRLDDDELEMILEHLQRKRKARAEEVSLNSLEQEMFDAAEQLADDMDEATRIEVRNRKINIIRRVKLMETAANAHQATGQAAMGLHASMVGINTPFAGSRMSVDAEGQGLLRMYLGGMVSELRKGNLLTQFNSRTYEDDIARELWDVSLKNPTGQATKNKDAKAIATIVNKYRRIAIERENRAGAHIKYRSGYITRQTHDMLRMRRGGKEAWTNHIAPLLDWNEMDVPVDKRADFLSKVYDRLSTRVFELQDESGNAFMFKGPGNLAKKESASRVLLFKDADSWLSYNERFGKSSLMEGLLDDFRRSAQSTALMDRFGTNPRAMFDTVRNDLISQYEGDAKQVDALREHSLESEFKEIDGSVNYAKHPTAAAWGRGIRSLQSMAKLGGAFISAISDVAAVAAERRYQGRSLAHSWGDALQTPFNGLTNKGDERVLAEMIGIGIDGMLGDFVSRFAAQDDAPGRLSKMMSLFFKLNLLGPWTDANKRGMGLMISRDLAAKPEWSGLDVPTKRLLEMYGFDEAKWGLARQATIEHDGKAFIVPDAVPEQSGREGLKVRDEVSRQLAALISDRVDFGVPTPGARERAFLRQGMEPGTILGEGIRFVGQFKSFPVTVMMRGMGRDLYGKGAKTMRDALIKGEGDRLGIASFIAMSTILGFFAMQSKEIAKGREPRQIDQSAMFAAILQGGGLGIYGDFLLGETNRFGHSMLDTLAGPTLIAVSDLDKIRAAALAGEDFWAETLRVFKSNAPFINLFYSRAALDYLILYQLQEMTNPGYLRRMERRVKRENNQTYFLPPSRAIPHGGGNRLFEGVR